MSRYQTDTRYQAVKLLRQGASPANVEAIISIERHTISRWRKADGLPQAEESDTYARISRFAERRLRYAAKKGMDPEAAAEHAGVDKGLVRGFWRKIGHNYITPEQAEKIRQGISEGANKPQTCRHAEIDTLDLNYFLESEGLKMEPHQNNPSAEEAVFHSMGPTKSRTLKLKTPGHRTMKYVGEVLAASRETVTSPQLLDHINANILNDKIMLSAASKRLRKAYQRGLLEREWDGHKWVYKLNEQKEPA